MILLWILLAISVGWRWLEKRSERKHERLAEEKRRETPEADEDSEAAEPPRRVSIDELILTHRDEEGREVHGDL